jgi:hypothetical protein
MNKKNGGRKAMAGGSAISPHMRSGTEIKARFEALTRHEKTALALCERGLRSRRVNDETRRKCESVIYRP